MKETSIIQNASAKVANAAQTPRKTMTDLVKSMEGEIRKALPSVITPERFTRMVLSAISTNPKLAECTPRSFLGAMMLSAQLGVEPNSALGQAYILPYKNHGVMEAQFQLGYKGLLDLAYRSGEVAIIQAHEVCENDEFEYSLGLDPVLHHVPAKSNRGQTIAYYAMFKTKSGGYGFEVMSIDDVREHAKKYSKSFGYESSPWKSDFDSMAKKTVLKRCLKYAPLRSDYVRGASQDETIKTEISDDMFEVQNTAEVIDVDPSTGDVIDKEESGNA